MYSHNEKMNNNNKIYNHKTDFDFSFLRLEVPQKMQTHWPPKSFIYWAETAKIKEKTIILECGWESTYRVYMDL